MLFTRASQISGVVRTKSIAVTDEQWAAYKRGTLIQDAMPNISDDEREFIMTGITAEEWDATFGGDDE